MSCRAGAEAGDAGKAHAAGCRQRRICSQLPLGGSRMRPTSRLKGRILDMALARSDKVIQ